MAEGIITLSSSTFDETVQSADAPIIVDFWAEWCGPCKMIAPILEEIASEHAGVQVAKLNVDDHPDLARRFDVMSIPTLLVFDGGEVRKRLIGAKGKGQLLEELSEFLGNNLPLTRGHRGEAVRDLQRRLGAAGFGSFATDAGSYCAATEAAVRSFQSARGLRDDGVCDAQTWAALVEASYTLGDRTLYQRSPNLRGDNVGELQRRLGRLGFDAGRIDGIFGPLAANALHDFQRNVGLRPDGICGYESLQALRRLGDRGQGGPAIASVREHELLRRASSTLDDRRIVIGEFGGLGMISRAVGRSLRAAGAAVMIADDPDGSVQASASNRFGADCYVGLAPADGSAAVSYYGTDGFESLGGRRLAELLYAGVAAILPVTATAPRGMRMAVLRETRMPAVLCELGPVAAVTAAAPRLGDAIGAALLGWVETPVA